MPDPRLHRIAAPLAGLALLAALACSDLAGDSSTPITLEVRSPVGTGALAFVEIGDTVQFTARALNQAGDSVAADIRWRTPDTTLLAVDSLTGAVTGKAPGPARVQARTGNLVSDFLSVTVVVGADTVFIVPPDSARVAATDSGSAALVAQLDTLNPEGPVSGRRIEYELLFPVFGQPGDTATLNGGVATLSATTGSTGQPTSPVTVQVVPGQPRPDSVLVEVRSRRPSGALVPGSGQQFIVRFD